MESGRLPFAAVTVVLSAILAGCGFNDSRSADAASSRPGARAAVAWDPPLLELTATSDASPVRVIDCKLINHSDADVRILAVRANCTCTIAEPLERTVLKPREAVWLRLKVSFPAHGTRQSTVNLTVDPPGVEAPQLRLVLHGPERPVPYIEAAPEQLRLVGTRPGETVSQGFQIGAVESSRSDPWILGASATAGGVEVELVGVLSENISIDRVRRSYQFRMTGRVPNDVDAPERISVALSTSSGEQPDGAPPSIPASLVTLPLARAVPTQIALSGPELSRGAITRRVMIVVEDAEDYVVTPPTDLPAWITVAPLNELSSKRVRLFEVRISEPPLDAREALRFSVQRAKIAGSAELVVTVGM